MKNKTRFQVLLLAMAVAACDDAQPTEPKFEAARPAFSVVSGLVSNVRTVTGGSYALAGGVASGQLRYADRTYTFAGVPAEIQGVQYLKTKNADKNAAAGSSSFLSFQVSEAVNVYVAHDDRAPRPAWLTGWTNTGSYVTDSDGYSNRFTVFRRAYPAGTVTLGSNVVKPQITVSMYTVAVKPSTTTTSEPTTSTGTIGITGLKAVSGRTYQVAPGGFGVGKLRYTDRDYNFYTMPSVVEGATFIRTPCDDAYSSATTTSFLTFTLDRSAVLYIAHDDRITTKPAWLAGWTDTGMDIARDPGSPGVGGVFSLFRKSFAAGTVTLGGNGLSSSASGAMYSVAVVPATTSGDTQAPSVPTALTGAAASSTQINLSWAASTDNVGVSGYHVYRNGTRVGSTSGRTYSSTGLTAATKYSFTVAAYDAAGNVSAQSAAVSVTTKAATSADTQAPSVPASLSATASSSSRIDLSWGASTDNVGVSGYHVYRNGTRVASTSLRTYADAGLLASTTYRYTVAAYDAAGNASAQSAAVSATTKSATTSSTVAIPQTSEWVYRGRVLTPGGTGTWDDRWPAATPGTIVKKSGKYFLYYVGADGVRADGGPAHRKIGVATSTDGRTWTKYSGNPRIAYSPNKDSEEGAWRLAAMLDANGTVLLYATMLTNSGTPGSVNGDIRLYTSTDGVNFTDRGVVVRHSNTNFPGGDELGMLGAALKDGRYELFYTAKGTTSWDKARTGASTSTGFTSGQVLLAMSTEIRYGSNPIQISSTEWINFAGLHKSGYDIQVRRTTNLSTLGTLATTWSNLVTGNFAVYLDRERNEWLMLAGMGTDPDNLEGLKLYTAPVRMQ